MFEKLFPSSPYQNCLCFLCLHFAFVQFAGHFACRPKGSSNQAPDTSQEKILKQRPSSK